MVTVAKPSYYIVNHKRVPYVRDDRGCVVCPHCKEATGYNFGGFMRHLKTVHPEKIPGA